MNSKGHLYISLAKSFIRIGSAVLSIWLKHYEILALGIMVAEIGGILEEVFDKR
jgi:uncharacterized integral membrane protein